MLHIDVVLLCNAAEPITSPGDGEAMMSDFSKTVIIIDTAVSKAIFLQMVTKSNQVTIHLQEDGLWYCVVNDDHGLGEVAHQRL